MFRLKIISFLVFLFSVFSFSQDSLEQVSPEKFQNQILRSERLKKIAADSSRSKEQREFANAAVLYYSGNFEDLGINTLFVDEAHNYKNLSIQTKIMRVNGITSTGSKKCDDMYLKVRCVQQNNNGRGVIFATGTPITNSLSDIYVMQMYLQSGELIMLDLQTFDSWVGMFVEKQTTFEIDVDTTNYRMVTRFSSYTICLNYH